MKQPTKKVKSNNNKKTIMPNNLSLYNFYRRIINKKSEFELKYNIKKYINLINESKSKNDMYNLFLLLINLRNFNLNEKKIYYHILKELLLDYQTIISVIIRKYPPNYGLLNDFKKIYEECLINGTILDNFKFVLNLNEAIDNQIEIDNQYNNNIDKYCSLLLENNKISNSKDFVKILNLTKNELMSINSLLIVTKEGIFK
jgi:hypothetical protein